MPHGIGVIKGLRKIKTFADINHHITHATLNFIVIVKNIFTPRNLFLFFQKMENKKMPISSCPGRREHPARGAGHDREEELRHHLQELGQSAAPRHHLVHRQQQDR